MKTLILSLTLLILVASCNTPIRIVESYHTDSTGRVTKTITKYYDSTRYPSVQTNIGYNPWPWGWYDPFWRGSPYFTPRTIIINPRPPVRRK